MPHILKELLYHAIIYDYGSAEQADNSGIFSLDNATPEEIQKKLGDY